MACPTVGKYPKGPRLFNRQSIPKEHFNETQVAPIAGLPTDPAQSWTRSIPLKFRISLRRVSGCDWPADSAAQQGTSGGGVAEAHRSPHVSDCGEPSGLREEPLEPTTHKLLTTRPVTIACDGDATSFPLHRGSVADSQRGPVPPIRSGGLLRDGAWRPLFSRTEAASRSEPSHQAGAKDCRKDEATPTRLRGPGWSRYRHTRSAGMAPTRRGVRLRDSGVPTISLAGAKRPCPFMYGVRERPCRRWS